MPANLENSAVATGPEKISFHSNPKWTVACQAPLSMGFSRQEYWSGFLSPLQRIFPTQGSNLGLPHCRKILYCLSYREDPPLE